MLNQNVVMLLMLGLAGCADDGSPVAPGDLGPERLTLEQAKQLCEPVCERDAECGSTVPFDGCVDACAGYSNGSIRGDVYASFLDCAATLACDSSDDGCGTCELLDYHDAYEASCRARLTECGLEAGIATRCDARDGISDDDLGGVLCVLQEPVVADLAVCLESECEEVEPCLDAAGARLEL